MAAPMISARLAIGAGVGMQSVGFYAFADSRIIHFSLMMNNQHDSITHISEKGVENKAVYKVMLETL